MFAKFEVKSTEFDGGGDLPTTLAVTIHAHHARKLAQRLIALADGESAEIPFFLNGYEIWVNGLGPLSVWGRDIEVINVLQAQSGAPLEAARVAHSIAQREYRREFKRYENLECMARDAPFFADALEKELRRMARNARFFADALEKEAMVLREECEENKS